MKNNWILQRQDWTHPFIWQEFHLNQIHCCFKEFHQLPIKKNSHEHVLFLPILLMQLNGLFVRAGPEKRCIFTSSLFIQPSVIVSSSFIIVSHENSVSLDNKNAKRKCVHNRPPCVKDRMPQISDIAGEFIWLSFLLKSLTVPWTQI